MDRHEARGRAVAAMKAGTQLKRQHYDHFLRDQKSKEFYQSPEWKQAKEMKMSIDPLCEACLQAEHTVAADMVHHIFKITTAYGWERRLDLAFLLSLCLPCHNAVEAEMKKDANRQGLEGGPP